MDAKRILFITQEITPYLPETEISKICRNLPQGIQERSREIRTFMPRYGNINERRNQLHEVIRLSGMNLIIDDTDHPLIIKVASIQSARMQVYFIDNEDFFHRKATVADDEGKEFDDNDERAIFYVRGVLETVKKLRWIPDLVHCHGWLSALAPIYLKKMYADDPSFAGTKVVYSVYADSFKKSLNKSLPDKMKQDDMTDKDLQWLKASTDFAALSSLAIQYSDGVIQGSQKINKKVSEYIEQENKLFLPYQEEGSYIDAYNEFYDKVLNTKSK
ncbi:MAG: glycogen/starch synthase [Tannerella sp.]|jgi:starch synthase|nr:glycogen/starch synthase [Tannerella sp.]